MIELLFISHFALCQLKVILQDLTSILIMGDISNSDRILSSRDFGFWKTQNNGSGTDTCYKSILYRRYVESSQEVIVLFGKCDKNSISTIRYGVHDLSVFNTLKEECEKKADLKKIPESIKNGCLVVEYKNALLRYIFRKCFDSKQNVNEYFLESIMDNSLFELK